MERGRESNTMINTLDLLARLMLASAIDEHREIRSHPVYRHPQAHEEKRKVMKK